MTHDKAPNPGQQKVDDALAVVQALGLPPGQQNDRSALTLLALVDLKPTGTWASLSRPLMGITPIMQFCREHYGREYAPNTRETFRRYTMHQFVEAGMAVANPDEPGRPVNSPAYCYQITEELIKVFQTFGSDAWKDTLAGYLEERETLANRWAQHRDMQLIPVQIEEGAELTLTPGVHSRLIEQVITEFAPRFAPGAELIYVGDTGNKVGYFRSPRLADLGVTVDEHGKMPDVVLYLAEQNWLLLVEAVTSHGPVNPKRRDELTELFAAARPGLVYVTTFPDRRAMARHLSEISWESEVWCVDSPSHLIHFDGERFLGPYNH